MNEQESIMQAAGNIADGLADLLTWAHEEGSSLRDQHVQSAGGDDEAKTNPMLRSRGRLIDKLDRALRTVK